MGEFISIMAIKAILFDLDNTLVDFMRMKKLCSEATIHAMVDAGLRMPQDRALRLLFKMYWKHGIEDQNIFEKFLRATIGKVDYKILASGVVAYRKVKAGHLVPYPHVRETLIKLKEKGMLLGIVSDAPRMQAWLRLAELNLTDFFDFVIALEDTGKRKPSKLPFRAAIKKLGLQPEEILFVGDSPARDIKGAKSVGMRTALAAYGLVKGSAKKAGADFVLRDIKNLQKIV
ncbi:MAG: HAD-IIIA family hydrolase [Candidatus Diapherotrites archaeon]|nr:HAD-IIIA family hydrolase [Candidatus Diapherotrites archaeon]